MEIDTNTIVNTTKLILYKRNKTILEKLDFDLDTSFLEPLLFAYFNNPQLLKNHPEIIYEILQGYFKDKEPLNIKQLYNSKNIAYLPNLGYYNTDKKRVYPIEFLASSNIELLLHKTPLLNHTFRNSQDNVIEINHIEVSTTLLARFKSPLENALQHLKKSSPSHFKTIEQCCKKIMLFRANPVDTTNSFATQKAMGMVFINAYQEDYDEVFFIDDIAHQTGHAIMFSFWFNKQEHFIIDPNTALAPILNNPKEYRNFYVLFHALYTYYTSVLCLDNCIEYKLFNDKQEQEALARIGFYLNKYQHDLICFEKVCQSFAGIENVVKNPSINLYSTIKEMYIKMVTKYGEKIKNYRYENQPYNFTFSNFMEINP